jgi:hypothetical protein
MLQPLIWGHLVQPSGQFVRPISRSTPKDVHFLHLCRPDSNRSTVIVTCGIFFDGTRELPPSRKKDKIARALLNMLVQRLLYIELSYENIADGVVMQDSIAQQELVVPRICHATLCWSALKHWTGHGSAANRSWTVQLTRKSLVSTLYF